MKLSKQILLALSIVLLLSIIDSYTNYLLSISVRQNTTYLAKSESIIRNSANLHKSIIEMQSAFRGFLLTEDQTFLGLYRKGAQEIPALMKTQVELVKENPTQKNLLDSIDILHHQWIVYSDSLITAKIEMSTSEEKRAKYNYLFETKLKKQVGKKLNDSITGKFLAFDRYEYGLRSERSHALMESINTTHTFSFIFLSLTIIIGVISTIYIIRIISNRIDSMVQLAENISNGQFNVVKDTRNDELTALSKSLNVMSQKLDKNIKELEKRNAELNQFAYVVSHDLKAPVRGIYNVTQWIEEDLGHELSPPLRKYLSIIPQRTKRMENLINGLLDYARTRERTHEELIDTQLLVSEIVESIVPRNFSVELIDLPVVYSERLKLEQVFTNLVSNAVKYINHENGQIRISCRETTGYYEFSVKDNGIGIDPEYHEKIFEIFQTLRDRNDKESTGIGLTITKKIIDDKHCSIKVYSSPGKGAEFAFTWPINKINADEEVQYSASRG